MLMLVIVIEICQSVAGALAVMSVVRVCLTLPSTCCYSEFTQVPESSVRLSSSWCAPTHDVCWRYNVFIAVL